MAGQRKKIDLGARAPGTKVVGSRTTGNRRRRPKSIGEAVRLADSRARSSANRPANRRSEKWVHASIAASAGYDDTPHMLLRLLRWVVGLLLVPLCGVTSWTFFSQFSSATLEHEFWRTTAFWYFATGGLLMAGWFWSGLAWKGFLYLYVLGHELTHILFIWLFRGQVSAWGVSTDGGFVTTNKSNIVIALAPYCVPLWAALAVLIYAVAGHFMMLPPVAMKSLLGALGFFWAFHLLWTLWMIPRDQPDLRENGTFLSLTIIYLTNLLILVALMCVASPQMGFSDYVVEWRTNAVAVWDGANDLLRVIAR